MEIRRALTSQVAAGTDLLARAFLQDPGACRLYRREGSRRKALEGRFASMMTRPGVAVDVAVEHDGTEIACAVWAAGGGPPGPRAESASVMAELRALASHPSAGLRMLMAAPALRRLEGRCASPGCCILVAIGVEPCLRGLGIGAALLSHGLVEVDSRRAPCYLETTNATNIDFYVRHGFQVAGFAAPLGSVRTIAMTRAPGGPISRIGPTTPSSQSNPSERSD
jgi:ribosomal protein S18 acetylase RimI-like enzyme